MIRLLIILLMLVSTALSAADRCADYVPDVRREHMRVFGPGFPWWYGVGQLRQESCCRNVTAFDGGIGIAQFMPKTSEGIQKQMREKLNPYLPKDAVRMQAFYMHSIHARENWTKMLWIDYQIYNGGKGTLYKEFRKAGIADHDKMRVQCKRKVIQLKKGPLDMCNVNYDYSKNVYKYGQAYKIGINGITYW